MIAAKINENTTCWAQTYVVVSSVEPVVINVWLLIKLVVETIAVELKIVSLVVPNDEEVSFDLVGSVGLFEELPDDVFDALVEELAGSLDLAVVGFPEVEALEDGSVFTDGIKDVVFKSAEVCISEDVAATVDSVEGSFELESATAPA